MDNEITRLDWLYANSTSRSSLPKIKQGKELYQEICNLVFERQTLPSDMVGANIESLEQLFQTENLARKHSKPSWRRSASEPRSEKINDCFLVSSTQTRPSKSLRLIGATPLASQWFLRTIRRDRPATRDPKSRRM